MARTRALQDLIADVRFAADIEGATARHTDQAIVRSLNQSQQALRQLISDHGIEYYLTSGGGVMTAGDDRVYPLPGEIVAVYGVDVLVNEEWRELAPFQMSERNALGGAGANAVLGVPTYYRLEGPDLMRVAPAPDSAYAFQIWFLPRPDDLEATFNADGSLATSTAVFDGMHGWEDWLVYDTALRISARDAGVNDNYELLTAEHARIQARILSQAKKRVRNGPVRRVDTRGRRQLVEAVNRWRLLP
jgi:hypothetical protein